MDGTRVNDLSERRLVRVISDSRQVSRERKGSVQQVSGGNLAFIVSETGATFDWSDSLDGAAGTPTYGQARLEITLTSSVADVPLVDLAAVLYYSPDGVTWSEYTQEQGLSDQYNATGPEIYRHLSLLPGFENASGEVKFAFLIFGKYNSRVAFKLQATGIDAVSINVLRVA